MAATTRIPRQVCRARKRKSSECLPPSRDRRCEGVITVNRVDWRSVGDFCAAQHLPHGARADPKVPAGPRRAAAPKTLLHFLKTFPAAEQRSQTVERFARQWTARARETFILNWTRGRRSWKFGSEALPIRLQVSLEVLRGDRSGREVRAFCLHSAAINAAQKLCKRAGVFEQVECGFRGSRQKY